MKSPQATSRSHLISGFLFHIHPKKVADETLRFNLSFGLGGMALTLLLLLFTTGILQSVSYTADISEAYKSVTLMHSSGSFSGWIRNIHYWSGNMLVIVALLHFCRVVLTGAIAAERYLNWIIGLLLLCLVLFANFSGYLLPWDQLAFWAVTIFTSMLGYIPFVGEDIVLLLRGGSDIGSPTLAIFYAIHTGILPFCFVILTLYHFWLVRKARGLVRLSGSQKSAVNFVPAFPNLIVREAAVGFVLIALILVFAAMVDAPLDEIANPAMSPNPAKAAWFFLGFQELLMHLHPTFAILVIPSLFILYMIFLPLWENAVLPAGQWFGGKRGKSLALSVFLLSILVTFGCVFIDETLKTTAGGTATDSFTRGVLPSLALVLTHVIGYFFLTKTLNFTRAQTIMACFIFSLTSLCCLTCVAIWLRGPGMQIILPF